MEHKTNRQLNIDHFTSKKTSVSKSPDFDIDLIAKNTKNDNFYSQNYGLIYSFILKLRYIVFNFRYTKQNNAYQKDKISIIWRKMRKHHKTRSDIGLI